MSAKFTKVYDQDGILFFHGDNRDILPHLAEKGYEVDIILTDPPYNVSHLNGGDGTTKDRLPKKQPKTLGRRKETHVQNQMDITGEVVDKKLVKGDTGRDIVRHFGAWDLEWSPREILPHLDDLLRDGGQFVAFTSEFLIFDWLNLTPFDHRGLLFWLKTNPTPALPGMYLRPIEIAVYQTKGSNWTFNGGGYVSPVYEVPAISGGSAKDLTEPRVHPTQKPQELWRKLLATHTNPGDLVLDPFSGSFSLGRACYDMQRRYIGMDRGCDDKGIPWVEHGIKLMRQVRLPF
jgi:DNA modification methylase